MSVNPGFGAQKFIPGSIRKISELNEMREKFSADFLIEVDGGVGTGNIKQLSDAGCNAFVIGSSIFSKDNMTAATVELKNIIS
jgi:ribulose-phosphate 3-epimerase